MLRNSHHGNAHVAQRDGSQAMDDGQPVHPEADPDLVCNLVQDLAGHRFVGFVVESGDEPAGVPSRLDFLARGGRAGG